MEPQVIRMYPNGPRRWFCEQPFLGGRPYSDALRKGFAGRYVCEVCQSDVSELTVAAQQWVCRSCVASGQQRRDSRGSTMKATRTPR
jgi:hypothetical protein